MRALKGRDPVLLADFFWRLFEATGSIRAYLLYKRLSLQ
ncbi:MAG: YqzL family protein [Acetobacteraceae bacterium]|nr:YqzL family protein [Acetobacteraceae bacterium]